MYDNDAKIIEDIKSWYSEDATSLDLIIDLAYRAIAVNELFKEPARHESDYGARAGIRLPDELINWSNGILLAIKGAVEELGDGFEEQGSNVWAINTLCTYFGYDTEFGKQYKHSNPLFALTDDDGEGIKH